MSWYQYPQEIFSWFDFVGVLALRWLYAVKPYVLYEAIRGNNTNTLYCFYTLHNSKIIQVFVVNPVPFLPCLAFSGAACHSGYPKIGRHQPGAIWSNDPYISFILIPHSRSNLIKRIFHPHSFPHQGGRGWLAFVDRSRIPQSFRRARICKFLRQKRRFLHCGKTGHLWLSKDLHKHRHVPSNTLFDV